MTRAWWKIYHELAAAYQPPRPESTFKGTVLCLLRHHFKSRRYWMIVAEALLREIAAEQTPDAALLANIDDSTSEEGESSESEDEEETRPSVVEPPIEQAMIEEVSEHVAEELEEAMEEIELHADQSFDSQGNETREARKKARRPDYSVSKSHAVLFRNQTHLWVEVKNGSEGPNAHTKQLRQYITRIAAAIPPGFLDVHPDVVLMLIDANRTYYWRITPEIVEDRIDEDIWGWAHFDRTFGPNMTKVLNEISRRPGINLDED